MTFLNPTGNWRHGLGEVAEWSKANDSKSFEGKPSVGSNPTLSVLTAAADDSIFDGIASRVRVYTVTWLAEPPKPKSTKPSRPTRKA